MFVRVKKVGTYRYLQIAENRREGKRVKQTIIATLGRLDKLAASGAIDQLLRSAARITSASLSITPVTRSEVLCTKNASDLTATGRPPGSSGESTSRRVAITVVPQVTLGVGQRWIRTQ